MLCDGHSQRERRALALATGDANAPAVLLDDLPRPCQSQASAADAAGHVHGAVVALEYVLEISRRDADAVVRHRDFGPVVHLAQTDPDVAAARAVLDRV